MPQIEAFSTYRDFLAERVAYLKATQRGFSYRRFARRAGFASPSFLKLVIQGKRNLSQESIGRFAAALDLGRQERTIFEHLVHFEQAKTDTERNHYYDRLRRQKASGAISDLEGAQHDVYTRWYVLPIREMVTLPGFVEDPEWIAKTLWPRIRAEQAKRALDLLIDTGMLIRTKGGHLEQAETKLKTAPSYRSLAVRNFHRANIKRALEAIDRLPVDQRNLSSITATLTPTQYEEVCERIATFQRDLLNFIDDSNRGNAHRDVYSLNFQVVPGTRCNG